MPHIITSTLSLSSWFPDFLCFNCSPGYGRHHVIQRGGLQYAQQTSGINTTSVEAPIIATARAAPIIANRLYLQIEETYFCLCMLSKFFMPRVSFWWVFSRWSCLWEPTGRFLVNSLQIFLEVSLGDGVELPLRLVLACNFMITNSLVAGCILSVYFVCNLPMLR